MKMASVLIDLDDFLHRIQVDFWSRSNPGSMCKTGLWSVHQSGLTLSALDPGRLVPPIEGKENTRKNNLRKVFRDFDVFSSEAEAVMTAGFNSLTLLSLFPRDVAGNNPALLHLLSTLNDGRPLEPLHSIKRYLYHKLHEKPPTDLFSSATISALDLSVEPEKKKDPKLRKGVGHLLYEMMEAAKKERGEVADDTETETENESEEELLQRERDECSTKLAKCFSEAAIVSRKLLVATFDVVNGPAKRKSKMLQQQQTWQKRCDNDEHSYRRPLRSWVPRYCLQCNLPLDETALNFNFKYCKPCWKYVRININGFNRNDQSSPNSSCSSTSSKRYRHKGGRIVNRRDEEKAPRKSNLFSCPWIGCPYQANSTFLYQHLNTRHQSVEMTAGHVFEDDQIEAENYTQTDCYVPIEILFPSQDTKKLYWQPKVIYFEGNYFFQILYRKVENPDAKKPFNPNNIRYYFWIWMLASKGVAAKYAYSFSLLTFPGGGDKLEVMHKDATRVRSMEATFDEIVGPSPLPAVCKQPEGVVCIQERQLVRQVQQDQSLNYRITLFKK